MIAGETASVTHRERSSEAQELVRVHPGKESCHLQREKKQQATGLKTRRRKLKCWHTVTTLNTPDLDGVKALHHTESQLQRTGLRLQAGEQE